VRHQSRSLVSRTVSPATYPRASPADHAILKYVLYLWVSTVKYGTNTRSRPAHEPASGRSAHRTCQGACPDLRSDSVFSRPGKAMAGRKRHRHAWQRFRPDLVRRITRILAEAQGSGDAEGRPPPQIVQQRLTGLAEMCVGVDDRR
jgi:hypothetical protein